VYFWWSQRIKEKGPWHLAVFPVLFVSFPLSRLCGAPRRGFPRTDNKNTSLSSLPGLRPFRPLFWLPLAPLHLASSILLRFPLRGKWHKPTECNQRQSKQNVSNKPGDVYPRRWCLYVSLMFPLSIHIPSHTIIVRSLPIGPSISDGSVSSSYLNPWSLAEGSCV